MICSEAKGKRSCRGISNTPQLDEQNIRVRGYKSMKEKERSGRQGGKDKSSAQKLERLGNGRHENVG